MPSKGTPFVRLQSAFLLGLTLAIGVVQLTPFQVQAACCYFAAKDKDVNQPGQKAFITWDAQKKLEAFTVQPKFEGNAGDFGMVIPTPSRPKLDEMPREAQFPSQGATLFVDLERRELHTAFTPLAVTRTVLGGRGANMYYLHRLLDESLTPLDPGIPLIFGSGLLTGLVPSAARGNCTSWSPESGVLLDSNAGDYFPSFLRMNGYDHIVLYGQAAAWTMLMSELGVDASKLQSILCYDGLPVTATFLVQAIEGKLT